jgi:pimeloyl-ACP methyl ester carboxylesterase
MRNAAAMQALTRSSDPFPEFDRSTVARLTMPALLLQGEHTSTLHRQVMNELASVMRDAKRIEIPRAGHGSPSENPDAFNAAVVSFLEGARHG